MGIQKALDKWKLVFDLVSSLVSQDTINTKYEEKILHNLWKVSCSEGMAGRDKETVPTAGSKRRC